VDSEHGQTGEVRGPGQQGEVGVDARCAADTGPAPAVASTHEVGQLAFDLGTRGAVVGAPGGVALANPGPGQCFFVGADADGAPFRRGGALVAQRAVATSVFEVGHATTSAMTLDLDGDTVGARDGAGAHLDVEAVLGEEATGRGRLLGLAPRVDV
jgi:hypothetical protein